MFRLKYFQLPGFKNIIHALLCIGFLFTGNIQDCLSQWQFLGCPETGTPVNFDAEGDTVFVCTRSDLFYSSDNAQSWVEIPTPDSAVFLNQVLIENGHLYLVTLNSLYRSEDLGKTWKSIGISFTEHYDKVLVERENLVLGLNPGSLAVSHNAGDLYQLHDWAYKHTLILHNNILITLDSNQIVYSEDFGFTWDSIVFVIEDYWAHKLTSIEGVLWRKDEHVNMRDTRFSKSLDNGKTWETVIIHHYFAEAPGLTIVGQGGNLFIASKYTYGVLLFSADKGKTWIEKNMPNEGYDPFFANDILFFHSKKGILLSRDYGDSFVYSNKGFTSAEVDRFAWFNNKLWVNANSTMFEKALVDNSWISLSNIQNLESTQDGHLVGRVDGAFRRSSDGGINWIILQSTDFDPPTFILGTFVGAGNMMYSIDQYYRGYFSLNYGVSWQQNDHKFNHIDFGQKYLGVTSDNEFLISDNGIAWEDETNNLNLPHFKLYIKSIHYHNGYAYANLEAGNYRLAPGSSNWNFYTHPVQLNSSYPIDINTMESYQNVLFAGTHGYGVFTSTDNGDTWTAENMGLENKQVLSSAIIGDNLYIGVRGGVWKRPLNEFKAVSIPTVKNSLSFSVSPIPSNDVVYINFESNTQQGKVHFAIIDAKGTLIKTFLSETSLQNSIDIKELLPGIYFLFAEIDGRSGCIEIIKN